MSREHTPCMAFECLIFTKAAYTQQKSLIWLNCLQVSALLLSHLLICLCIVHQTYIYAHNKHLRIQKASESLTGESTSGIIYLLNPPIWSKTHQSMATSCLTFIICFFFCIAILLLASFFRLTYVNLRYSIICITLLSIYWTIYTILVQPCTT